MSGPFPPPPPPPPPPPDPALAFSLLDYELPLALFPVRLEARFLPDGNPTEIVIRVFPDDIVVDRHDPTLTAAELALARTFWETIWRSAARPSVVSEARAWLAAELGAPRALYVAAATQPDTPPPTRPTPPGAPLVPKLVLGTTTARVQPTPGKARLMPERWAAFVQVADERFGPYWASHPAVSDLAATPALVELPSGADARGLLDAQGLGWTHDLAAAESAGMVIRIPLGGLPPPPSAGYDRLYVLGSSGRVDHQDAVKRLMDAHRYTRGLEILPPGTPTNVTEASPIGAGSPSIDDLFDREFAPPAAEGPQLPTPPPGRRPEPGPSKPEPERPRRLASTEALFAAPAADAIAIAFGLRGQTAIDKAASAADDSAELALAANRALWQGTLGAYLSDPMRWTDTDRALLGREATAFLRNWFTDFVRADGPLPTLRVGTQPYGILPVRDFGPRDGDGHVDSLENVLHQLYENWYDEDRSPRLDPDSADTRPDEEFAAEQASEVGAIYGATPHLHEIRLRAVEDTYRDLSDLYALRVGVLGLLCALVPKDDGSLPTPEELPTHPWYQIFERYEPDIRGAHGLDGQIAALDAVINELDATLTPTLAQEIGVFRAIKFIDKFEDHGHTESEGWPPEDSFFTGDLTGMLSRHQVRVFDIQPQLSALGAQDALGAEHAPRMYTGAYDESEGVPVGAFVTEADGDAAVADVSGWLAEIRDAVRAWEGGGPTAGTRPSFDVAAPSSLVRQLLQAGANAVPSGAGATSLRLGIGRLLRLVRAEGAAGLETLDWLMRGTLGLAMYRVDAWITSLASVRLAELRLVRPSGLQVGGFGWLRNVKPRQGRVSQGFIHAPSLDHAVTAAVLRSGWTAFGTEGAGSPLAVNLSSERVRAAKTIIESVRSGQELGRLLGSRFERRLHDRLLDRYIDDIRAAVLTAAGTPRRPTTRFVDGLLLARGFTQGIELTDAELAVAPAVQSVLASAGADAPALRAAIADTVGDLDAVADVLTSQAVHSLLRGDAAVAVPTLAATGSSDSGLPAIDFPRTPRGGRQVTLRVLALFPHTLPAEPDVRPWSGAATSPLAIAEPRLEAWAGRLLGSAADVVIDFAVGTDRKRRTLDTFEIAALDVVFGVDQLRERLLAASGLAGAAIVPGRPAGVPETTVGFDELVTLAGSLRDALGRGRALTDTDFALDAAVPSTWDTTDLAARLAAVRAVIPFGDARLDQLAAHEVEHPETDAEILLERLHLLTVHPLPILPLLVNGVPDAVRQSFERRAGPLAAAAGPVWLAQAAKTRPGVRDAMLATELSELARDHTVVDCALAQIPDADGRAWVGAGAPEGAGLHVAFCCVTGEPQAGPVAGLVIDSWTETVPDVTVPTGIATHFDRPSACAPNAVLLVTTRPQQAFSLDYVADCLDTTLRLAQFRAMGADDAHPFVGHFVPAVFLPGEAAVVQAADDTAGGEDVDPEGNRPAAVAEGGRS